MYLHISKTVGNYTPNYFDSCYNVMIVNDIGNCVYIAILCENIHGYLLKWNDNSFQHFWGANSSNIDCYRVLLDCNSCVIYHYTYL